MVNRNEHELSTSDGIMNMPCGTQVAANYFVWIKKYRVLASTSMGPTFGEEPNTWCRLAQFYKKKYTELRAIYHCFTNIYAVLASTLLSGK